MSEHFTSHLNPMWSIWSIWSIWSMWSYFHLFNLSDEENCPVQERIQHFPLGMLPLRTEVVSGGGCSLVNAVCHFFMCASFISKYVWFSCFVYYYRCWTWQQHCVNKLWNLIYVPVSVVFKTGPDRIITAHLCRKVMFSYCVCVSICL